MHLFAQPRPHGTHAQPALIHGRLWPERWIYSEMPLDIISYHLCESHELHRICVSCHVRPTKVSSWAQTLIADSPFPCMVAQQLFIPQKLLAVSMYSAERVCVCVGMQEEHLQIFSQTLCLYNPMYK